VQSLAQHSHTQFLAVRFGNVLGSSGSVVPRFQEQIKAGGPVTVTHPEVRRYFMSIPEAVTLVLHAASIGENGETYILEMGKQIKLLDLARNLIRLAGHVPDLDIPIQFVGLRLGEKLEEELVGNGETAQPSSIDKILRIQSLQGVDQDFLQKIPRNLSELGDWGYSSKTIGSLRALIPNFQPPKNDHLVDGQPEMVPVLEGDEVSTK
jgi:FlaA1/EpsC-like NDP-sugar epimerase